MRKLTTMMVLAISAGVLVFPASAENPASPRAAHERIVSGPQIERVDPDSAIIRWTTDRGASHIEYSVVQFGTDPSKLSETGKSPNRWNASLPNMTHRVLLTNLKPGTTYYYSVSAVRGDGALLGSKNNSLGKFTTRARAIP
jgi:phosphodiesterase/alkaline phosphatase D-like protein